VIANPRRIGHATPDRVHRLLDWATACASDFDTVRLVGVESEMQVGSPDCIYGEWIRRQKRRRDARA
jgi:hypothetical protein